MSSADEHLATRHAAGLFDFSFMGLYEFENLASIQGVQTRNVEKLEPERIAYTLLLNEDGAVLIDATVWRLDHERFWLFAGRRAAYGGRDRSGELAILALQGPASGRVLARLIGKEAVLSLRYFHFANFGAMTVGRLGYSGELGYELLVPAAEAPGLRKKLIDLGRPEGLCECSWAAADSLRIEAGYVLFDREVDGRANPRELGLERFVDAKQSFPVRKRLVGLEILEGEGAVEGPAAVVTSECFSPSLGKAIALGYAHPGARPGTAVRLAGGRTGRLASLPFYDPGRLRPRAVRL
jgi:glycine cleavage system T protein (aminomethyltransferase)